MLYNQPVAHRFGTALATDIESGKWQNLEFAVAWVRRSGTQHLESPFSKFLRGGGFGQLTVGIDIENTSAEGLRDLLDWQAEGSLETHIYHNEANPTFHPKLYLLRNDKEARLIVGSNNITGAGLFINTEAGLQLDAPLNDPVIQEARTALAAWRDTTALALRLDETVLGDLIRLGYVFPEHVLRQRRKRSGVLARQKRGKAKEKLFKSQHFSVPPVRGRRRLRASVPGSVLLLRVRRASETGRRTQIQLPKRVVQTAFFTKVGGLVSAHDGRAHTLIRAKARGGINTIKVEIPEIEPMSDPVLRLERTPTAILYQAFDALSVLGRPIQQALLNGFAMNPPTTFKTVVDESHATWWRFI